MESLSATQFESLINGTEVLSCDDFGENVFRAGDGKILKLFRPRRNLSSSRLSPYAKRFANAAKQLKTLHVPTIEVIKFYDIPHLKRHMIGYRSLDGDSLRTRLEDESQRDAMIGRLAVFCAELHAKGIYFRGLHLDNIIVGDDDAFGLIDLSGAQFSRGPLGPLRRARNFRPLVRETPDREAIERYGTMRFINNYLEAANLPVTQQRWILFVLPKIDPIFINVPQMEDDRS